jgi:CBS domain-containing protein
LPEARRNAATVAEVLDAGTEQSSKIRDDAPIESLLFNESLRDLGALIAVDADGKISGVITIDQVSRAVKGALSAP